MVRGGIDDAADRASTVFCDDRGAARRGFLAALPFAVLRAGTPGIRDAAFREAARSSERSTTSCCSNRPACISGEDIVALASHLRRAGSTRCGAAAGCPCATSRSLSPALPAQRRCSALISYVGSHVLSLAYLLLFGRYMSDTLSGARAVRAGDALRRRVASDAQAGEPAPAVAPAAPQGRAARDAGAVRPDLAGAGEADERVRRPAVARCAHSLGGRAAGVRGRAAGRALPHVGRCGAVPTRLVRRSWRP